MDKFIDGACVVAVLIIGIAMVLVCLSYQALDKRRFNAYQMWKKARKVLDPWAAKTAPHLGSDGEAVLANLQHARKLPDQVKQFNALVLLLKQMEPGEEKSALLPEEDFHELVAPYHAALDNYLTLANRQPTRLVAKVLHMKEYPRVKIDFGKI